MDPTIIQESIHLREKGLSYREISKKLSVSYTTVYRCVIDTLGAPAKCIICGKHVPQKSTVCTKETECVKWHRAQSRKESKICILCGKHKPAKGDICTKEPECKRWHRLQAGAKVEPSTCDNCGKPTSPYNRTGVCNQDECKRWYRYVSRKIYWREQDHANQFQQDWRATYMVRAITQGGLCYICQHPETVKFKGKVKRLALDHNRSCCPDSKKTQTCGKCCRLYLCAACNIVVGYMEANSWMPRSPEVQAYLEYCKNWHEQGQLLPEWQRAYDMIELRDVPQKCANKECSEIIAQGKRRGHSGPSRFCSRSCRVHTELPGYYAGKSQPPLER